MRRALSILMYIVFICVRAVVVTLAALIVLAAFWPAEAAVLKDIDAQADTPRTGVVIVGVNTYINSWEATNLTPNVVVNDAYANRLGEAYAKKDGVHYVEVLTGTDASSTGITRALTRVREEKLDMLTFAYRGYGLGADGRDTSCFMASDWDHRKPEAMCLNARAVSELVDAAAVRALVMLDASSRSEAVEAEIGYKTWGPTADDWPNPKTPVISADKAKQYTACGELWPMIVEMLGVGTPGSGLLFGALTTGIAERESTHSIEQCGGNALHVRADGTFFATDVYIPNVAPPVVAMLPEAAPLVPAKKPAKKLTTPTIASLAGTGACLVLGGVSTVVGENRLAQYNNAAWAAENYPHDDAGRITDGEAEIPVYGALAVTGFTCAGIGAAASGLTWYFGK